MRPLVVALIRSVRIIPPPVGYDDTTLDRIILNRFEFVFASEEM